MIVYTVHHSTVYRYRRSVGLGQHQILFRPRDSFDQRLLDCKLEVRPDPVEIRWIHDVFGNCLTLVDFNTLAEVLEFETTIRLEHTPEKAPDFRIEEYAREHPFAYDGNELPDLAPYIRRHYPDDTAVRRACLVHRRRVRRFEPR
ncbi:transglutaminase N-terminal domain-containing protein [Bradyrhizobium sp. CAR08]